MRRQHYINKPAPVAVNYVWFALPDGSKLYFPLSERKNVNIHTLDAQTSVYSLFATLAPAPVAGLRFRFRPSAVTSWIKNRFTIVCRQFDQAGNLIVDSKYFQCSCD